jgi:hypothetical protein
VTRFDWLAAIVLFLQSPIPSVVVHSQVDFWRRHEKASHVTGVLFSCPPVAACLGLYHQELFRRNSLP